MARQEQQWVQGFDILIPRGRILPTVPKETVLRAESIGLRKKTMAKATPPGTGEEMGTATSADGTEIAFKRTGSGPPLVLVHGAGLDHNYWELSGASEAGGV